MDPIEAHLQEHTFQENRNFDRLTVILEKFSLIETRINSIDGRLAKAETNLEWIMKAFWAAVVPLAGGLVATVLTIINK